MMKADTNK